jgi:hypothetical protein
VHNLNLKERERGHAAIGNTALLTAHTTLQRVFLGRRTRGFKSGLAKHWEL